MRAAKRAENLRIALDLFEPVEQLDFTKEEITAPEAEKTAPSIPPVPAGEPAASETADRASKLQADLDAVNAELRITEDNESSIKASLEEKASSRQNWNPYQSRYLQQEAEPLQKELSTIQAEKSRTPSAKGIYRRRDEISSIRCIPVITVYS